MANYKRRRSALLNVIQGLEDSDVVSDDVVEMDEIEETIPETAEDDLNLDADDDLGIESEDLLPEDKDDEAIVGDEEQVAEETEEACDEKEQVFSDEELEQVMEALDDDDECQNCEVTASETESGIEDEITDTVGGGDPTTSEVAPGGEEAKSEVQTDAEVYPTESAYVASLVRKFDRIADELEKKGMKRLAYRLDKLSDRLEKQYK